MDVYLLAGMRTPIGNFMGGLSSISAPKLGSFAIKSALDSAQVLYNDIDEIFMGQVLQAGVGQAPARQSAILAGLSNSTRASTINKVCGSGMESIIQGARSIINGDNLLVVSGGMENMSKAPYLIPNMRMGSKFGEASIKDSLEFDGLQDSYSNNSMGVFAEQCVDHYKFTRKQQDDFAIESFKRAQKAMSDGVFDREIIPIIVKNKKSDITIKDDEGPLKANFDKIPKLKPAFKGEGSVTAANSSTINDGAAAVILGGKKYKDKAKFKLVAYAGYAGEPSWFTTAPIEAIKKCVKVSGISLDDIGLIEINEAFAAVAMASMGQLKLSHDKVNIYGGAISLGHPIGCSGTRIVVTLMNAMVNKQVRYGMAAICIGGGEALSIILEQI